MKNLHGIILILFLSFLVIACSNTASDDNKQENEQSEAQKENDEPLKEETPNQTVDPDDEQLQEDNEKSEFNAEKIMNEYKTIFLSLLQEAENDGKLTSINSKKQLISYLQQKMSKNLASSYANTYFQIEDNGIYMKAMDSPTWLDPSQTFKVEKINEKEYKVIQERNNELLGHVNVTYKIIFSDTRWIVDDIQTKKVESNTKPQIDGKNNLESISKEGATALTRDHLNLNGNNTIIVKVDHQDQDKYVVHVYEVVKQDNHSHTATLGWYDVYKSDGRIENIMQ